MASGQRRVSFTKLIPNKTVVIKLLPHAYWCVQRAATRDGKTVSNWCADLLTTVAKMDESDAMAGAIAEREEGKEQRIAAESRRRTTAPPGSHPPGTGGSTPPGEGAEEQDHPAEGE